MDSQKSVDNGRMCAILAKMVDQDPYTVPGFCCSQLLKCAGKLNDIGEIAASAISMLFPRRWANLGSQAGLTARASSPRRETNLNLQCRAYQIHIWQRRGSCPGPRAAAASSVEEASRSLVKEAVYVCNAASDVQSSAADCACWTKRRSCMKTQSHAHERGTCINRRRPINGHQSPYLGRLP